MECKGRKQFETFTDGMLVLIETSWNVKGGQTNITLAIVECINRNIVECKGEKLRWKVSSRMVLIETSWNVKNCSRLISFFLRTVLIETSWNVKC